MDRDRLTGENRSVTHVHGVFREAENSDSEATLGYKTFRTNEKSGDWVLDFRIENGRFTGS